MGARGATIVVAVALAAGVVSMSAEGYPTRADRSPQHLRFTTTPARLSSTDPTPVTMRISDEYRTGEEDAAGPLRVLPIEGDREIVLDLEGVPVCDGLGRDIRRDLDEMERLCGDAAIGHGRIEFGAFFPGDRWILFSSRMTLYNLGPGPGGPELFAFAYFTAPVTAALRIPVELRRLDRGPFGWEARASIPKIIGGKGEITEYALRIDRRFLSATCSRRKLELRVVSGFFDRPAHREKAAHAC